MKEIKSFRLRTKMTWATEHCAHTQGEREREKEREFQKVDPAAESSSFAKFRS